MAGGANAYGFAGGDPVNFSDPFGLCPPCSDRDEALQSAGFLDPFLYIGGIAGGLRAIGTRLLAKELAGTALARSLGVAGDNMLSTGLVLYRLLAVRWRL